ncbi:MAG: ABC transporter permease [Chloroflexi bacterium]|nr:ABC transporter permease [Chloroflexota bacterium]MBT7080900.1 ABC transporter permease [Chloroflexota bacterium]MBT7290345.1 ABC transporter permease [Chloroflexota bacterium]
MTEIWDGLVKAFQLIFTFDPTVTSIAARSLWISASACLIATAICVPLGAVIHFNNFKGKKFLISTVQTLWSMPTVAMGLLVFLVFSRSGPLGIFGLLFSPSVMIIGQVLLISPLILGLVISALNGIDKLIPETAVSLGASRMQKAILTIREARYAITAALIMGFGRAISEVGLSIMVGGNIARYTRTIPTAIALETQKGNIELSIALGIILILIAFVINISLHMLQRKKA